MQKHRIFIAINLPEEVKNILSEYQNKRIDFPARWTKPDNLHITLVFIGDVDDEEIGEIKNIIFKVAENLKTFPLSLDKISYGPLYPHTTTKFGVGARMIWALGEASKEFIDLKNQLEKELSKKIRFAPEKIEASLHITLARIKEWEWRRIEPEERPEVEEMIDLKFQVSSIELMESVLKRSGPEYKIIKSYNLKLEA